MDRNLKTLAASEFDVAVLGGGIFGACAAWDAAQRGLSVALIEKGDFCGATSANHLKMVHGGIRYIQHGDIYRVRQSSAERRAFLRIAPHLVKPLPILIPTYGLGMKGKPALRIGMGLYDLLTLDRNRGISDPARKIPWGRSISREDLLRMVPGLPTEGLTGAAVFCDGQMQNPPRLVLGIVQAAVEAGATVANYVEATGFVRRGSRVTGVKARDVLSGSEFDIRAKVVLNASGPFAESLLQNALGTRLAPPGVYSRDACFVVSKKLLPDKHALAVQGTTRDPDARFSRGARHLFIAPWRDYTLVGVWHVVWSKGPDSVVVTDEELQTFIAEVNGACPSLGISLEDVSLWNAGLVPFGQNSPGAKDLRYGHRSRLIDHAATDAIENLITLIGVRFTTGRWEAQRAVDLVLRKLARPSPPCRTAVTPIPGGDIEHIENYTRQASRQHPVVSPAVMRQLITSYGNRFERVLRHAAEDATLASPIGSSHTIQAQVLHAIREEMAHTLGDVVFRRTELATGEYPGRTILRECADLMAGELKWDARRIETEIDRVAQRFPARVVRTVDDSMTALA